MLILSLAWYLPLAHATQNDHCLVITGITVRQISYNTSHELYTQFTLCGGEVQPGDAGPLFTKRTDAFPKDLETARFMFRFFFIALAFDRHLGSNAAYFRITHFHTPIITTRLVFPLVMKLHLGDTLILPSGWGYVLSRNNWRAWWF